jgi:hypothetical protein
MAKLPRPRKAGLYMLCERREGFYLPPVKCWRRSAHASRGGRRKGACFHDA